jgi:hypothetical protein
MARHAGRSGSDHECYCARGPRRSHDANASCANHYANDDESSRNANNTNDNCPNTNDNCANTDDNCANTDDNCANTDDDPNNSAHRIGDTRRSPNTDVW